MKLDCQQFPYAGRDLEGVSTFWYTHFILPKKVIKMVKQACNAFFVEGPVACARGLKMKWAKLCFPQNEVGSPLKGIAT